MGPSGDTVAEETLIDGRYRIEALLNSGSYGEVFLATDIVCNQRFAVKRLGKPAPASDEFSSQAAAAAGGRSEEVLCHESLGSHPNIVNLIRHFETDTHVYLVLEFCENGDLFEAIQHEKGPLQTEHVRAFMLQLVDAVEHMHSRGFYHRDIKPENILLTEDGDAKLGDFGLVTRDDWSLEVAVGSERYMAPEQYDPGDGGYSPALADVWAVGICLLNVLFSSNPFRVPQESDTLFADYLRDPQCLFDLFPRMTFDTFEVLSRCLALDPERRSLAAVRDALDHVVSFTLDDESDDDFCTETREVVQVPSRREPLRTPSIRSPHLGPGLAFPWAHVLHTTSTMATTAAAMAATMTSTTATTRAAPPPPQLRPLSVITDLTLGSSENDASEPEPASLACGCPETPDSPAVLQLGDSGLGLSLFSLEMREAEAVPGESAKPRPVPVPVSGSVAVPLPAAVAQSVPLPTSIFGKAGESVSKSWYDIWDEEAEELAAVEGQDDTIRFHGGSAPEQGPDREQDAVVSRSRWDFTRPTVDSKVEEKRWRVSSGPAKAAPSFGVDGADDRDDFFHVRHPSKSSASFLKSRPSPPRPDIMDRWAALGRRRRAFNVLKNAPAPRHTELVSAGPVAARGLTEDALEGRDRRGATGVWGRTSLYRDGVGHQHHPSDDAGDLELVGGWHDFHLDG